MESRRKHEDAVIKAPELRKKMYNSMVEEMAYQMNCSEDSAIRAIYNCKMTRDLCAKNRTVLQGIRGKKLDTLEECTDDQITLFQNLIGILQWAVELGRIDIGYEVSVLSKIFLISTSPALTHEFPSLRNPYHIHRLLTRATTFCKCTESAPVVHNNANICRQCSSLIKNNHRPTDVSQATYTTCISCDQVIHDIKYPNMPCESCFLTAIIIQNNPAQTWYTLTYRTTPNMSTVVHTTPYSYISHLLPSTVHHQAIPPEEIFQPRQEPLLREQYPFTEDPDFHFQELLEDVPFTELKPFPPRPQPMEFPDQYAEATSHNIVTKVHQTFHPNKFPSLRPLYLTYSHPTFPYFDGIQEPKFGHYPEAYIDTNLPNLAKALPYIQIRQVPITQAHPLPTKQLQLTTDYQTIITWSFTDHPKRNPNQRLGPIPESFISIHRSNIACTFMPDHRLRNCPNTTFHNIPSLYTISACARRRHQHSMF